MSENKITLLGAGLVGTLFAMILSRRGYSVEVYEKRPDPRKALRDEGRSINLALSHRGLKALRVLGLEGEVLENAVPMKGRMMHDEKGALTFQPYGEEGQWICSVSRGGLNKLLINAAEKEKNIHFFFSHYCEGVNLEKSYCTFQEEKKSFDYLIGADGAFSILRRAMEAQGVTDADEEQLTHSYKELHISPEQGKSLEKNALHIWPRKQYMLIALPNADHSFTCTLFLPREGEISFEKIKSGEQAEKFFKEHFPDALSLIPDLKQQYEQHPESLLYTLYTYPWAYKNALLIGDAAHAIVPFYGQGMNAGFEDATILNEMLATEEWSETLIDKFQKQRKKDTDAIAELALQNFIEMRDKVADERFLLMKKIEAKIHREFPEYLPLYTMVTFSSIPYSEALQKGKEHEALMEKILALPEIKNYEKEEVWGEVIKIFRLAFDNE